MEENIKNRVPIQKDVSGEKKMSVCFMTEAEIIRFIEHRLGIELYYWQKLYIFGKQNVDAMPNGRGVGRTLAYMLYLLVNYSEPPIHLYRHKELTSISDGRFGTGYDDWFTHELRDIYTKLNVEPFNHYMRKIYFTKAEYEREKL